MVAATDNPTDPRATLEVGANSAFLWSPQGGELAVADQPNPDSLIFERLRVVSSDGSGERTLVEEPLIAFYWSPDGTQLAYVSLDTESRVFEWKVIDREGNGQRGLFRFQPTGEVLTMLSFFDQYAHSHSPWSPDSAHLVVAGTRGPVSERRNGHTPTGAQVFVVDVTGAEPPKEIASGTLAFWSWN
jgi:TolB protein